MIKTKFGNAKISRDGYYQITSTKESNNKKFLHRLVWEDWYGKPIPSNCVIHHLNNCKIDNRIQNLQCVPKNVHDKFHRRMDNRTGSNNPFYDKEHSLDSNIQHSLKTNSTGYFRVTMDRTRQGKPQYVYRYYENKKPKKLKSISIVELEKKVKEKNLEWFELKDISYFGMD